MFSKIKKLIRDSNPMNHKQTFIEKCLMGSCYKVEESLNLLLQNISNDKDLQRELGLTDDEYMLFVESDEDHYLIFQDILLNRIVEKKH